MSGKAYFLVGATASGKSDVAHVLARRMSLPVLSIDSMQVYEGLDIGTAKPTFEERAGLNYYGLDIVPPSREFSVADFSEYVRKLVAEISGRIIVCGGTGLYAKALTEGLDSGPEPDRELRQKWERVIEGGQLELLKQELKAKDPEAFASLQDKENPRRLLRALEWAKSGRTRQRSWKGAAAMLTGLDVPPDELRVRIDVRAERMFRDGLLAETKDACERFGPFSRTASQAIGYSEALAVIDGEMGETEAVEKVKSRTRRLAKKQRTWFRNQSEVDWINAGKQSDPEALADSVQDSWEKNGPVDLVVEEQA